MTCTLFTFSRIIFPRKLLTTFLFIRNFFTFFLVSFFRFLQTKVTEEKFPVMEEEGLRIAKGEKENFLRFLVQILNVRSKSTTKIFFIITFDSFTYVSFELLFSFDRVRGRFRGAGKEN